MKSISYKFGKSKILCSASLCILPKTFVVYKCHGNISPEIMLIIRERLAQLEKTLENDKKSAKTAKSTNEFIKMMHPYKKFLLAENPVDVISRIIERELGKKGIIFIGRPDVCLYGSGLLNWTNIDTDLKKYNNIQIVEENIGLALHQLVCICIKEQTFVNELEKNYKDSNGEQKLWNFYQNSKVEAPKYSFI